MHTVASGWIFIDIQLAFFLVIVRRISLSPLALCNTPFLRRSDQLIVCLFQHIIIHGRYMTANRFLSVVLFPSVKHFYIFYQLNACVLCVCVVCVSPTSFFNSLRRCTQFCVDVMPSYITPVSYFLISYSR